MTRKDMGFKLARVETSLNKLFLCHQAAYQHPDVSLQPVVRR